MLHNLKNSMYLLLKKISKNFVWYFFNNRTQQDLVNDCALVNVTFWIFCRVENYSIFSQLFLHTHRLIHMSSRYVINIVDDTKTVKRIKIRFKMCCVRPQFVNWNLFYDIANSIAWHWDVLNFKTEGRQTNHKNMWKTKTQSFGTDVVSRIKKSCQFFIHSLFSLVSSTFSFTTCSFWSLLTSAGLLFFAKKYFLTVKILRITGIIIGKSENREKTQVNIYKNRYIKNAMTRKKTVALHRGM